MKQFQAAALQQTSATQPVPEAFNFLPTILQLASKCQRPLQLLIMPRNSPQTPTDNLSGGTTFKLRITTSAKDSSSNSLASAYTTNGFTTSPSGSGTIKGTVRYDNGTGVDNVSVSFAKSGTTGGNTTTADNGTYSQDSLSLGVYNIAFTKSDYLTASLSEPLIVPVPDGEVVNPLVV